MSHWISGKFGNIQGAKRRNSQSYGEYLQGLGLQISTKKLKTTFRHFELDSKSPSSFESIYKNQETLNQQAVSQFIFRNYTN